MNTKVRDAMDGVTQLIETAAGWACVALALYVLAFVDLTGNGRLVDALRGALEERPAQSWRGPMAVKTVVVPVNTVNQERREQNRMLLIPDADEPEVAVAVRAEAAQPAFPAAAAAAASAPAWKRSLAGGLRKLRIYGKGEERSSASAYVQAPARAEEGAAAAGAEARSAARSGGASARAGYVNYGRATRSDIMGGAAGPVYNFRRNSKR